MQSTRIPKGICDEIEKLQRNFIWGHPEGGRRMHTLSWEVLCKNKECGGLGIKRLNEMNDAFLMKVGWRIIDKPDNLCSRVLTSKYGRGKDLRREISSKESDSILWKELSRLWTVMEGCFRWQVGNGKDTRFWLDNWGVKDSPLINYIDLSIPMNKISDKVGDLVLGNGSWNMSYLDNLMSKDLCLSLCSEIPPMENSSDDKIVWGLQSNGSFSVKSAYNYRINNSHRFPIFKLIWRLDVPERVKIFIWLLAHNRIPTRELCNTWFGGFAWCEICPSSVESSLHILRDCPPAIELWNSLVDFNCLDNFYALDIKNWVESNLNNLFSSSCNFTWNKIWSVGVWQLWYWQNALVHNRDFRRPTRPAEIIKQTLFNFDQGINMLQPQIEKHEQRNNLIIWEKPYVSWVKLNCDGSLKLDPRRAGCGGLLRNSGGSWIRGFSRHLGNCSILKAEAWAVLEGIRLAEQCGVVKLCLESDSALVVNAINDPSNCPVEVFGIVRRARMMLESFDDWSMKHVWREANLCADFLANMGADRRDNGGMVVFETPPPDLSLIVLNDVLGLGLLRGSRR